MVAVKVECDYCGHRWLEYVYQDMSTATVPDCPKCKSNSCVRTVHKKAEDTDIYGYYKK